MKTKIPTKMIRKVFDIEGDSVGAWYDKELIKITTEEDREKFDQMVYMIKARHTKMSQEIQKLAVRLGFKTTTKTVVTIS